MSGRIWDSVTRVPPHSHPLSLSPFLSALVIVTVWRLRSRLTLSFPIFTFRVGPSITSWDHGFCFALGASRIRYTSHHICKFFRFSFSLKLLELFFFCSFVPSFQRSPPNPYPITFSISLTRFTTDRDNNPPFIHSFIPSYLKSSLSLTASFSVVSARALYTGL